MIKIKILRKRNAEFNENKYIYIDIDDKKNLVKGCFINIWVGNKNIYENREIINIRQNKGYYTLQLNERIKFKNSGHYITKARCCKLCHKPGNIRSHKHSIVETVLYELVNNVVQLCDKKSTKSALENENSFEERFNSDIEYKRYILKGLGLEEGNNYDNWKAYKSIINNGIILSYTEYWKEYKIGTKESSPTSKSDIFLKNNITGEIIPISIKSGHARLTSADCYESNALCMSVLYKSIIKHY